MRPTICAALTLVLLACGPEPEPAPVAVTATAGGEARNQNLAASAPSGEEEARDLVGLFLTAASGDDRAVDQSTERLLDHRYRTPEVEEVRAFCARSMLAGEPDAVEVCSDRVMGLAVTFGFAHELAAPSPTALGGDVIEGELTDDDPRVQQDDSPYDDYRFELAAGQRVVIDMVSAELDTYLWLIGPDGTSLVQDDDGGEGTNSHIDFVVPVSGTYTVRANSYDGSGRGRYQLRVHVR